MEIYFHVKDVQAVLCATKERSLCFGVHVCCNSCAHWSTLQKPWNHSWFLLDCSQVRAPGRWSSGLPQSQHLLRLLCQPLVLGKQVHGWLLFFLNGSFSELCRKFEAFHNSSWFFLFNSLSGPLGPLILPLQQVPMLQALEKPFCLQPLWRVTKDVRSKRFSSQDYMALTALNSNVASAGTFCTAGAMPRQV